MTEGTENESSDQQVVKPNKPKIYKLSEVEEHKNRESCWMVIHDKVYDVTNFLDEHPGGEEVLLDQAGGNATESFEDVGHSSDARESMAEYFIGELCEEDKKHLQDTKSKLWTSDSNSSSNSGNNQWTSWIIPIGLAVIATLGYRMFILQGNN